MAVAFIEGWVDRAFDKSVAAAELAIAENQTLATLYEQAYAPVKLPYKLKGRRISSLLGKRTNDSSKHEVRPQGGA